MAQMRDSVGHASELLQQGRLPEARAALGEFLARSPDHAEALHLAGLVEIKSGRPAAAVPLFERCVEVAPGVAFAWSNLGVAHNGCGDFTRALACFDRSLELAPGNVAALKSRGIALRHLGRHDEAMATFRRAAQREPNDAELHREVGDLLVAMGRAGEALARYDRSLMGNPRDPATHHNRGVAAWRLGDLERAQRDLRSAIGLAPGIARFHATLGVVLQASGQPEAAVASHRRAVQLAPEAAEFHDGLGVALEAWGRRDEALAEYGLALSRAPDRVEALENRGLALAQARRYDAALADFERVQALSPGRPYVAGHRLQARLALCDWNGLEPLVESIAEGIADGRPEAQPFPLCYVDVPPATRLRCAQAYSRELLRAVPPSTWRRPPYAHKRLRVGYLSADMHEHPVGQLLAPLVEAHDSARIEAIGLSFGPDKRDALRRRLERAFGRFEDVRALTAAQIAERARSMELDVAVDLMGHTTGARTAILAHRVAPVQVQFMGYPGTMGADCIDYLVTDATVVPQEHFAGYSEKIAWVRGTALAAEPFEGAPAPSRGDAGLPGDGFVFACFCNHAKITPDAFASWMRILAAVPGSVLWLADPGPAAGANLRAEAGRHGLEGERLLFAQRVPTVAEHLRRLGAADLFLDTFHYGGHVTASDALRAGVPVLARMGDSFAARVSASLLRSLGLEELIARSTPDYEGLAVTFAKDAPRLAALRQRLAARSAASAAFTPAALARDLEELYARMVARHRSGEAPSHLSL